MRTQLFATLFLVLTLVLPGPAVLAAGTTREDPIPFGQSARVGDWQITVTSVNLDATTELARDLGRVPNPAPDNVFVLVKIDLINVGTDPGSFGGSGPLKYLIGQSNVAYDYRNACRETPGAEDDLADVFPKGHITSALCWEVAQADVSDLVMYFKPIGEDRIFFSIDQSEATPEATPSA